MQQARQSIDGFESPCDFAGSTSPQHNIIFTARTERLLPAEPAADPALGLARALSHVLVKLVNGALELGASLLASSLESLLGISGVLAELGLGLLGLGLS